MENKSLRTPATDFRWLHKEYAAVFFFLLLLTTLLAEAGYGEDVEPVDYDRQIRPILSDRCYRCHGPDANARKANLRLDTRDGALTTTEDGQVIVEGKPRQSLLIERVLEEDDEDRMPPPGSKLHLSAEEIGLIERWIAEGAPFDRHWSFDPPESAAIPDVSEKTWSTEPIDRFVLERLVEEGFAPAPEADRTTLARRASFLLTGLPPDLDRLDRFLADESADAWPRWIDALLDSPRYGERMASDWLDLARYADSYGYQSDVHRPMWQWRDWVIDAFNSNLSFDRFVTWQLAGDLLEDPTPQQRLATAFNRLHRQTNEGGSVEEEYRLEYVADRTQTFATAFLGLTLECARCHDHKFDPITQREFYSLSGFFSNIDESGLYSHFTSAVPTPSLALEREGDGEKEAALKEKITAAELAVSELPEKRADAFSRWRETRSGAPPIPGDLAARFTFDQVAGGSSKNAIDPAHPAKVPGAVKSVPGTLGNALLLTGDDAVTLSGAGAFTRADPFSFAFWIKPPEVMERAVILHRSRAWTDAGSQGYQILIEDGRLSAALIHFWPGDALAVETRSQLIPQRWTHVVVTYDGSSRARGLEISIDGNLAEIDIIRDHLTGSITGGGPYFAIGERFRDRGFKGGEFDELVIANRVLSPLEIDAIFQQAPPMSSTDSIAIPNLDQTGITSRISVDEELRIEDLDVGVTISHTWIRELSISLTSPEGTEVTLKRATPELNTDIDHIDVIFDDEGSVFDESKLPLSGRLVPQGPGALSDFDNEFGDGSWALKVVDGSGVDTGTLQQWTLMPTFRRGSKWGPESEAYFQWWLSTQDEVALQKRVELKEARKALNRHRDGIPRIMAMEELPRRRKTHLLHRGRYDQPREEVSTGVPGVLGLPLDEVDPDRLDLANWLFDRDNPLSARVAVNRLWQIAFGVGLVATPEDFGSQGLRPTHPELLDHLALDFIASGWDIKAMLKKMLTSRTWRQSSENSRELLQRDPDNLLLARGPGGRMTAEMIRDHALWASGLLIEKLGGPSVFPYQPPGLWQEKSGHRYTASSGESLYRRSLYTFWKRTSPPPTMMIFDASKRDVCSTRRHRTSTPMQSLVLMNDPQFVEAARMLARRMIIEESGDSGDPLGTAFRLLLGRFPSDGERRVLEKLRSDLLVEFAADPEGTSKLLAVGASAQDPSIEAIEWAAMTAVCSTLMSHDEATRLR